MKGENRAVSFLRLKAVSKRYGRSIATESLDLSIDHGEFVVLVGPSGCGKTTVLRIIAGLETPDRGRLELEGRDMTTAPPKDRHVAMVFQSDALYPHMTVRRNLTFGLGRHGTVQQSVTERVDDIAKTLGLTTLLDRYPSQLSGGQQQRVAVGRSIVQQPKLFLMDEPLSNLDAELRVSMRAELRRLHESRRTTTLYVTHDQIEAMSLGDRIVVMNRGRIEQAGTPEHVYRHPCSTFVARFLGSPQMNIFDASAQWREGELAVFLGGRSVVVPEDRLRDGGSNGRNRATIGIRPECLRVSRDGGGTQGVVEIVEYLGKEQLLLARCRVGSHSVVLEALVPPGAGIKKGDAVGLDFDDEDVHLFDAETGGTLLTGDSV